MEHSPRGLFNNSWFYKHGNSFQCVQEDTALEWTATPGNRGMLCFLGWAPLLLPSMRPQIVPSGEALELFLVGTLFRHWGALTEAWIGRLISRGGWGASDKVLMALHHQQGQSWSPMGSRCIWASLELRASQRLVSPEQQSGRPPDSVTLSCAWIFPLLCGLRREY